MSNLLTSFASKVIVGKKLAENLSATRLMQAVCIIKIKTKFALD